MRPTLRRKLHSRMREGGRMSRCAGVTTPVKKLSGKWTKYTAFRLRDRRMLRWCQVSAMCSDQSPQLVPTRPYRIAKKKYSVSTMGFLRKKADGEVHRSE